MMLLVIHTISGLLFAVTMIIFRKSFYRLVESSVSLVDGILLESDDDNERQKILLSKLIHTISSYYKLSFFICVSIFAAAIPLIVFSKFQEFYLTISYFGNLNFIVPFSIGSIIPFIVFNRFTAKADYSELSILIHRLMMDNLNFARLWFNVEKFLFIRKKTKLKEEFLVVTGLARCGTTALTNALYKTNEFHTLTYRNMPGLMSPKIWKTFNFSGNQTKERSHGDGIMINCDSVEALDEFFWKSVLNDSYVTEEHLTEHTVCEDNHLNYLKYQKMIGSRHNPMSMYLTKNNNFMLRYQSLRSMNDEFKVILMFRDPVDHALSLQNQHRKHSYLQEQDPFILEYMNWLGHHEFGKGQKAFRFSGLQKVSDYDKDSLNFWVEQWVNYYSYVSQFLNDENILLLDYLDFLSEPQLAVETLEGELSMNFEKRHVMKFINRRRELEEAVDPILAEKAYSIFTKLKERKLSIRKAV